MIDSAHRQRHGVDQLAGPRTRPRPRPRRCRCPDGRTASRSRPARPASWRAALPLQRERAPSRPGSLRRRWRCDQPTVAISGAVKTLDDTPLEVERRDRVAEEVPHRDPALHRRDRRQHEDPGAVAGGVDTAGGGARDPVDLDEAAVIGEWTPALGRGPGRRSWGSDPRARMQCDPWDLPSVGQGDGDQVRRTGVTDSSAGLGQHVHAAPALSPRPPSTSAASASSPGEHPVAGADQGHRDAEREVGAGDSTPVTPDPRRSCARAGRRGRRPAPRSGSARRRAGRWAGPAGRRRWRSGRRRSRSPPRCRPRPGSRSPDAGRRRCARCP